MNLKDDSALTNRQVQQSTHEVRPHPLAAAPRHHADPVPVFVRNGYALLRLRPAEILFLRAKGHFTEIITADRTLRVRMSFSGMLEELGMPELVIVNRSGAGTGCRCHTSPAIRWRRAGITSPSPPSTASGSCAASVSSADAARTAHPS
jgi:hypothetical protein